MDQTKVYKGLKSRRPASSPLLNKSTKYPGIWILLLESYLANEHSVLVAARAARNIERQQKRAKEKEKLTREMQILRDKQAALSAQSAAVTNTGARVAESAVAL